MSSKFGVHEEDVQHVSNATGVLMLGVRSDTETSLVDADGDYTPFQMSATGGLRTSGSINIEGTTSTSNSDASLSTTAFNANGGSVQSSSTKTSVNLAASASSTNDIYNNLVMEITSGTGTGQYSIVSDYDGSGKTATVSLGIAPDTTSSYVIHKHSGQLQTQTQTNKYKTLRLASTASSNDDFYNNCVLVLLDGDGSKSIFIVTDYDGSTKVATVDRPIGRDATDSTLYAILGESGTAQSATSTTIVLESSHGHNTDDDHYNGMIIKIVSGTGIGQSKTISDYTGSSLTITVDSAWTTTPSSDSVYVIFGGWIGTFEDVSNYTKTISTLFYVESEHFVYDQQYAPDSTGTGISDILEIVDQRTPYNLVHASTVVSNYFRASIISLGTSVTGQIQTIFHSTKNLSSNVVVHDPVSAYHDCQVVKSVGVGRYTNSDYVDTTVTDEGYTRVQLANPRSAFDEATVAKHSPVVQLSFVYNLNSVTQDFDAGTQVFMVTEGDGSTAQVQGISLPPADQLASSGNGSYFFITTGGGTKFYVWYNVNSGNIDPAASANGIEVTISSTSDTATTVATQTVTAVDANANFSAAKYFTLATIVQITNAANGDVTSIQPGTMPTTSGSAATLDATNSMAQVTNIAAVGAYSTIRSNRAFVYRPGEGGMLRFSGMFSDPSAGTGQLMGFGNQTSGLYFGYNGTNFGIQHRTTGQPIIYQLQFTTPAGANETATITLDGIDFEISITSGDNEHNAYEVSLSNDFRRGDWLIDVVDDSVFFLSTTATASNSRNKTYAFSSDGIAVATFTLVAAHAAISNNWTYQTNWNGHRLLGRRGDVVKMVLDPTQGNDYQIEFKWGFGEIRFYVLDNETGEFIKVHTVRYSNENSTPNLTMPFMRFLAATYTESVAVSQTIKVASASIFVQGNIEYDGEIYSTTSSLTTSSADETPMITFKNNRIFDNKGNNTEIEPLIIGFVNDSNKSATIRLYSGGTIGETDYQYADATNSCLSFDITNTTVPSGGILVTTIPIGANESVDFAIEKLKIRLHANETFTITVQRNTTTNVEITGTYTWQEQR